MDPILPVVILGFVGGLVIAGFILALGRRSGRDTVVVPDRDVISSPVINIASIKVEGVGGLGLVVACIGVAIAIPAIGRSVVLAVVLGAACAAFLIARRKSSPLPSSGAKPGANTTLSIETPGEDEPAAMLPGAPRPLIASGL